MTTLTKSQQKVMDRAKPAWVHARHFTCLRGPNVTTVRRLIEMGLLEEAPCDGYPNFMVRLRPEN